MASETLYPVKDTSISSFNPDDIYGSKYNRFSDSPSSVERNFMGFDISSAPASADVSSVTLYMFVRHSSRFYDTEGAIRRISGSWTESEATWNNSSGIATGPTVLSRTFKYAKFDPIWDSQDVTALYKEAKDVGGSFDIEIRTEEKQERGEYSGNDFDSREARAVTDEPPYTLQKPYLLISYTEPPPLAFADVAISRRYGDRLYLSGKLEHIITDDEVCIKYVRPEDGTVHNLPSATQDYTYLKDTSGTYTFPDEACIPVWVDKFVAGHWEGDEYIKAHYEDTCLPGLYVLLVYDVDGTCEDTIAERLQEELSIIEPRYQYQVAFKTANLDSPEAVTMLEARRRQWARVTDKRVEPWGTDCFSVRLKYTSGWDNVTGLVWLCSAYQARVKAKFVPLPLWAVPDSTDYLKYFRAECDCAEFQESRKYGVPCVHIMAAYYHLDRKPPYCGYVQCD